MIMLSSCTMTFVLYPKLFVLLLLVAAPLVRFSCSDAFTALTTTTKTTPFQPKRLPTQCRGGSTGNNDVNDSDLVSALARWNQQWEIQQRASRSKSRWTKLILPKKQEDNVDDNITEEEPGEQHLLPQKDDVVYLLEPPSTQAPPSCMIVFCGGAGLGTFPQIAYNELLLRISDKLNAAVLAIPYSIGLDHFELAQTTGEHLRRAILHCRRDRNYSKSMPIYSLCHSLGCKLQTIYLAATQNINQADDDDDDNGRTSDDYIEITGMGWISFNNFSFRQTLAMAKTFADELRVSSRSAIVDPRIALFQKGEGDVMKTIFKIAETVVGVVGIDFSPNAVSMERLIRLKFGQDLRRKTRLFVFDDDQMDSSREFFECCQEADTQGLPTVSGLPGQHLTPVYFRLGVDDLPEETRDVAREAMGGWQSVSFGNEDQLNGFVEEVCGWILGKEPSRSARWQEEKTKETPQIAGSVTDTE